MQLVFVLFKQKTAYEMRISDWSSDVCSSDLEGRLCNICYYDAIHARGTCPECLQDRLLPGPPNADGLPICSTCADIPYDFHCERCDVESGHHRGRQCARCALRDDLNGDRKSTRLNSSHYCASRMPSSA